MEYRKIRENLIKSHNGTSGLRVWSVQDNGKDYYQMTPQNIGKIGSLFRGDCYILVKTLKPGNRLKSHVHFWIGSQAEKVEADDLLQGCYGIANEMGGTIFYREFEGKESREFLDLFQCGVRYFDGTAKTYRLAEKGNYIKRLFQVKGQRNVHVFEVPLSYKSLNKGDSFVLEDQWTVYCWNGKHCNKAERIKAIEVARGIRDELCSGKAEIVIADEGSEVMNERRFFQALGDRGPIQSSEKGGDDEKFEEARQQNINIQKVVRQLHRFSENGELEKEDTTFVKLNRSHLDSNKSYLLNAGNAVLFVWKGSKYHDENDDIFKTIKKYIESSEEKYKSSVVFMHEDFESDYFKQFFDQWKESKHQHTHLLGMGKEEVEKCAEEEENEENSDGPVRIWLVDGYRKLCWPYSWYGYFFENECYIIDYLNEYTQQHTIYIWQGKDSSEDDQKASLEMAQMRDKRMQYQATLVKLLQDLECDHFLQIMRGQMAVLKNEEDADPFYRIDGNNKHTVRTNQVSKETYLETGNSYLMKMPTLNYLWQGECTTIEGRILAERMADRIAPTGDLIIMREGHEIPAFWKAIGQNKGETDNKDEGTSSEDDENEEENTIRLFHCSDASGRMKIKEISPFDQKDLNRDDVMILDCDHKLFLWHGEGANQNEMQTAWETAKNFIEVTGRKTNKTVIAQEKQGFETQEFKSFFRSWDPEMALESITYSTLKKQINNENKKITKTPHLSYVRPLKQRADMLVGQRI
eukprot:TCONS_00055575-protein